MLVRATKVKILMSLYFEKWDEIIRLYERRKLLTAKKKLKAFIEEYPGDKSANYLMNKLIPGQWNKPTILVEK